MKTKTVLNILFYLWVALILSVYSIAQKPVALQALAGISSLIWTLFVVILMTVNAAGWGHQFLANFVTDKLERLLLGTGLGLGVLGLTGFGLAAAGWAKPPLMLALLCGMTAWQFWQGILPAVLEDGFALAATLRDSSRGLPLWMPAAGLSAAILTFILALAPPADGFDSLLYHLTVPEMWLRDGGLRVFDMPPYWFPSLVEGIYVWPLALGNNAGAQLLHFVFGLLVVLLVWFWVRSLWDNRSSWWAIMLLLTMPSLLWLAAWAYTDLALIFYTLGMLYSLWKWQDSADSRWIIVTAAMVGLAMGVKYTSFIVPLVAGGIILSKLFSKNLRQPERQKSLLDTIRFGLVAVLIASPWYLRNWLWMRNPFYPFLFGGPFWDSFRASWYAAGGTGLGWNLPELLLLPLTAILGYREAFNYTDGRSGPFYLILFPFVLWVLWQSRRDASASRSKALRIVSIFSAVSMLVWVYGVINTSGLWQLRLLFPGLIPLVIPMAAAMQKIKQLDTPKLRVSFIFSAAIGLVIFSILLDFGLLVLARQPVKAALGLETWPQYLTRIQPGYAAALDLVEQTPADAHIYFLCESRSYGMKRAVQPDSLMDNLAHDFYLYKNADGIIAAWQNKGYTHVLLARRELAILRDSQPTMTSAEWLEETRLEQLLPIQAASPHGDYVLFNIPPK